MRLLGVEVDGGGFLFGDAEFFAQSADGDDEVLQGLHRAGRRFVGGEVGGLRVAGEGDGFCGRCVAGVEGVPDLFGEEGHEGREQAQRGLEDAGERGEGERRWLVVVAVRLRSKLRRSLTSSRYQSQSSPQKNW